MGFVPGIVSEEGACIVEPRLAADKALRSDPLSCRVSLQKFVSGLPFTTATSTIPVWRVWVCYVHVSGDVISEIRG